MADPRRGPLAPRNVSSWRAPRISVQRAFSRDPGADSVPDLGIGNVKVLLYTLIAGRTGKWETVWRKKRNCGRARRRSSKKSSKERYETRRKWKSIFYWLLLGLVGIVFVALVAVYAGSAGGGGE